MEAYGDAQRAKGNKNPSEERAANWTAGATVAIAVFTFATIAVGIAQWRIQSRTLDEIQGEQRPFIFVQKIVISPNYGLFQKDLRWFANVTWENSGSTATKDLLFLFTCPSYFQTPNDPAKPSVGKLSWTSKKGFFGPKEVSILGGCNVSPQVMIATQAGKLQSYILARAVYADRARKRDVHLSEFCARIVAGSGDWNSAGIIPAYDEEKCDTHNCADDECPAEDMQAARNAWASAFSR